MPHVPPFEPDLDQPTFSSEQWDAIEALQRVFKRCARLGIGMYAQCDTLYVFQAAEEAKIPIAEIHDFLQRRGHDIDHHRVFKDCGAF